MKELVIISGKGGTGKTSVTGTLASRLNNAVIADCDVDAADLHLLLHPTIKETHDFFSGHEARIRTDDCVACGQCIAHCRFEAIGRNPIQVDAHACEGCGVCRHLCPVNAIDFDERLCGQWFRSVTTDGTPMIHAKLGIAAENSGKLVSRVRQQARQWAGDIDADWILVDGPPGTGCPVIASLTGADAVLIVTEPTPSGQHDLMRVLALARHFQIPACICVNKWDINAEMTTKIETAAAATGATILPRIPFDRSVVQTQRKHRSVATQPDSHAYQAICSLWDAWQTQLTSNKPPNTHKESYT